MRSFALSVALVFILYARDMVIHLNPSPDNKDVLEGVITESTAEEFIGGRYNGDYLEVNSVGGDADAAFKIATSAKYSRYKKILIKDCLSACAEFLIPSSDNVVIGPRSFVGLHISDFVSLSLNRKYFGENRMLCGIARIKYLEKAYNTRHLYMDVANETIRRLGIKYISEVFDSSRNCDQMNFKSRITMWFPNSSQIMKYWNRSWNNIVCADDVGCWRPEIIKLGSPGDRFVIGNLQVLIDSQHKAIDEGIYEIEKSDLGTQ